MLDHDPFTFRVTDLKQYVYCPRILYYHTVLPAVRPTTFKMEAGITAHEGAERREKRRSLRAYGLKEGARTFNVALASSQLALSGEVDMVIETESELIPVDYKAAKREGDHFRLQLMAYGRLLELARPQATIRRGFLYLIPKREAVEVTFTRSLRKRLQKALDDIRSIAREQRMPGPASNRRRCVDCEFRRFCNDVL